MKRFEFYFSKFKFERLSWMFWFSNRVIKLLSQLNYWESTPLSAVASAELSLASKNHNNKISWNHGTKKIVKFVKCCRRLHRSLILKGTNGTGTKRNISTVIWTNGVLNLKNHRKRKKGMYKNFESNLDFQWKLSYIYLSHFKKFSPGLTLPEFTQSTYT